VRRNIFAKIALIFLALLLTVLALRNSAERTVRMECQSAGFSQLEAIARLAQARPPQLSQALSLNPKVLSPKVLSPADANNLGFWIQLISASGAGVVLFDQDGQVIASSLLETQPSENSTTAPELREAIAKGEGRAIRRNTALNRDVLYYATRQHFGSGPPFILRLSLPEPVADDVLGAFNRNLWLAFLIVWLFASGASLLVSRKFTARLERLKQFSFRVSEGDFRPLPADGSGDALDELGAALNQSAARMDATIRALTEQRNLSSAILGSMVEGVAVINATERLVFANRGFAEILGLQAPPTSGGALVESVRQIELIEAVRAVLNGEPRVQTEVATGTLRQRFFAATVGAVHSGGTLSAVLVLHDITDLRNLERVRRDFVANVSHEFRTPLTAIQGFAETLLAGALDDQRNRRRFLEIILEHARRLARLTEDLLELSKMDADRLELEIRRLSPSQFVESCLETAQRRAAEKQLNISLRLPPDLPDIAADRRRLAEVLQNLLDNSIQYTLPGGHIELAAEATDHEVIFTVSDTGIGIPKADQPRIFERFYRVDAARSREAGGTGLGLAIAKHVIEVHHGRIWVESALGEGSKFHFAVPIFHAVPRSNGVISADTSASKPAPSM
jgi:two-component system phosphate regulon sensor histidine kinase PhoR